MEELRLYTFVNMYLSSMQQGIQSAHLAVDMLRRYKLSQGRDKMEHDITADWADNHKTMIVLNGGTHTNIKEIFDSLWVACPLLKLPFAKFHEDHDSLNGIMTCCGVIVPKMYWDAKRGDTIYEGSRDYFYSPGITGVFPTVYEYGSNAWLLIDALKSCSLAR